MFKIKEDYLINITSIHKIEDTEEKLSISTTGTFKEKDGKKYILYKEYSENNPSQFKNCILKIENNETVTLTKNGPIQSKLVLEKNKRHYSPYVTDFGTIMMGIFTNSVEFNSSENEASLNLKYSLDINSNFVSINEVNVHAIKKQTTNNENKGEKDV